MDLIDFGIRLREERTRIRLSQEGLAERTGFSRASIAAYEKGKTPPNVLLMKSLDSLGIDTDYVVSGRRVSGGAFDWDVARQIAQAVTEYARSVHIELSHEQLVDVLEILYPTALANGVEDRMIAAALRLAA